MAMIPLLVARIVREEDDMGDLEYLSRIANGELTSGILKAFTQNNAVTSIIATVPAGKDWYLMGWSVSYDNLVSLIGLQYPTGTEIDSTLSDTSNNLIYNGIVKGFKITANQTVTITKSATVSNQANLFVLEVDIGTSPELT